ncbi:hypothetical protein JTB14_005437 [Gonioctena quinquepunctata]|nr:hypothetical protein JTB14_005437 [Gonioctena quinquepunctata]
MADENAETRKRMKQLENQNLKLRKLLETAMEISTQDTTGISSLKIEAQQLTDTLNDLEREKRELEQRLSSVLAGNEEEIIHNLEQEHVELKQRLEEVLNEIWHDNSVVEDLKSEGSKLKQALSELESEKSKLLEKLEMIEARKSSISQISQKIHEKLSNLQNKKVSVTETEVPLKEGISSEETIMSNFKNLERTYRQYLKALEDQVSLESKVSQLEEKKEEIVNVIPDSVTSQGILKEVIDSNTNLIHKIKDVKSKLQSDLSITTTFAKSLVEPAGCTVMEVKVSELEQKKDLLYEELERSLEKSSRGINQLREKLSDPDLRKLINEIEVQKTLLLYNLRMLKIKDNSDIDFPKVPNTSKSSFPFPVPTTSELEVRAAHLSEREDTLDNLSLDSFEPSTSRDDREKLEAEVTRLENERSVLLRRLHSVSETSARRFEERQLQTQSELHSTFMREKSSEEMIRGKNYDDATNQLYANEDSRLEQRIRELEIENERIKKELESLLVQIRDEQNESQIPVSEVLRERLEEFQKASPVLRKKE